MNAKFKEWVVAQQDQLTGVDRKAFLISLKFTPDFVLEVIRACFYQWVEDAWKQKRIVVVAYDLDKQSKEILELFKSHFAKELESVDIDV